MPRKRKNAKKAGAKARAATAAQPRSLSRVPYASTVNHRPHFTVEMKHTGDRSVAHVRCKDLINLETQRQYGGIGSHITFPFYLSGTAGGRYLTTAFLPRLSQIGSLFSRWRVRSACVHYQSLASANSLGSVGVGLDRDYQEPASIAELASIRNSAVTPVWQNVSTPRWHALADTWFPVKETEGDPPLYIHILNFASSATEISTQGLFWLEVDIEFLDMTASFQDSISFVQTNGYTIPNTGAPTGSQLILPWQFSNNHSGFWDWAQSAATSYVTSGSQYNTPRGAAVGVDGQQFIEWFGDFLLDAVTLPEKEESDAKWTEVSPEEKLQRRPPCRVSSLSTHQVAAERRHPQGGRIASGQNVVYATSTRDAKPYSALHRAQLLKPYVAGDVTVNLLFQPLGSEESLVSLYSGTYSPGTGATEILSQWSGLIADPGHLFVNLVPDGAESRTVQASSSSSIEVVGQRTSYT